MEEINILKYEKYRLFDINNFQRQTYSVCSFASPGTVIIFNHFDFSRASVSLGKRYGTEKDVENLTSVFQRLNFNVHSYHDLTKENISKKLNEHISTVDWENSGSIVLIVLTHGEENGMLWASDHKYHCSQLWDPILQCDKLKDKFKFIILQACRGREREKRFHIQKLQRKLHPSRQNTAQTSVQDKGGSSVIKNESKESPANDLTYKSLPNAANNLLIAHATVDGCDSVRDTEEGTWFIQLFSDLLFNRWTVEGIDILDILMCLNFRLTIKNKRWNTNEGQTASFTSFLSHSILYKEASDYVSCGESYADNKTYQGRAYIYYDKNHSKEAEKFSDTMNQLLFTPIKYEIDHGYTAMSEICKLSHKNDFHYENFLIIAVFTKCESIIHNNVPLKEIYNNFSAENCPSLAGRMKAFFFLDANYADDLDVHMDENRATSNYYVTNHRDFFICRGHSKEFIQSLNQEMLWNLENPAYHLVQIVTTAISQEKKNLEYSSNFESTLIAGVSLRPENIAQCSKYLVEEATIKQPVHCYDLKYPILNFIGRKDTLQQIITETSSKSPGKKVITISGMSGVGKTQLVSVFCTYFAWMFNNMIWINAENEQTLNKSFIQLAIYLKLINIDDAINIKNIVILVYNFFKKDQKTLFIFDNYTQVSSKYLPDHVGKYEIYHILTTNIAKTGIEQEILLEINSFSQIESIKFIKSVILESTLNSDSSYEKLAEILGNFPLLVHLSASYIRENQISDTNYSIETFIDNFLSQSINVAKLTTNPKDGTASHYENTFCQVCKLKISKIQEQSRISLLILYIICYCEPDNIPLNIFTHLLSKKEDSDNVRLEINEDLNVKKIGRAISILVNETLINKRKQIGSVHRLLQECVRDIVNEECKELKVLQRALDLIMHVIKFPAEFKLFEMHAIKIYKFALKHVREFKNYSEIAILITKHLLDSHKTYQAREFITYCINIFESNFGHDSEESIISKKELINVLNKGKKFEESLMEIEKLISIMNTKYGENSCHAVEAQIKKATCLQSLKQYHTSLEILHKAISWYDKPDSQDIKKLLEIQKNKASILIDTKEYKNALELLENILNKEKSVYPKLDCHVISTLKYIAIIYENDENTEKQEVETYLQILSLLCQFSVLDHLSISEIQLKLGSVLKNIYCNSPETHNILQEEFGNVLKVNEESLGHDHIETIISQMNLITCMINYQNTLWKTLELADNLLKKCKIKFENEHERTLQAELRKAQILRQLGRKKDAIKIYEKLHETYEEKYGSSHFNTEYVARELENTKNDENKIDEIVLRYESYLYEKRDIVRDEIHDEIFSLSRQANVNIELENYTKASELYDEMLKLEEKYFPVNDICNLITKYNKYKIYQVINNPKCKQMIDDLYKLAQNLLGDAHDLVLLIKQNI